eukprot:3103050-Alexandrium_andersonii.AAC.1
MDNNPMTMVRLPLRSRILERARQVQWLQWQCTRAPVGEGAPPKSAGRAHLHGSVLLCCASGLAMR